MRTVRIISGEFGGRKILAPDGKTTHPMSERVRNALFNILGNKVEEAEVLDAFAGTGAIGLEALSRGAKQVTFIEADREAQRTLQENVKTLDAQSRAKIVNTKVELWHKSNPESKFDLIFCDPPFGDMQLSTVSLLFRHLKPDALMVLSQPGRGESLPAANGVVVVDNRSYGSAALTFYRQDEI